MIKYFFRWIKWLIDKKPNITYPGYHCGCCGRWEEKEFSLPKYQSHGKWSDTWAWGLCEKCIKGENNGKYMRSEVKEMKTLTPRRINRKVLFWNTIAYRGWVVLENALFLWAFGYLFITIYSLEISTFKGSFTVSIVWNIINMLTYWIWHYFLFRWFRVGAGDKRHKMEAEIHHDEEEIAKLKREIEELKAKIGENL